MKKFLENYAIWLVLIILAFFYFSAMFFTPLLYWDENVYLANSRSHTTESNFVEDYRFPLTEYFITLPWLIFGESVVLARTIIILITLASVFLVYLISKKFTKNPLLPAIIFGFLPVTLKWSYKVYPDILGTFFILLSFYLLTYKNNKWLLASGFFAGLAFLAKFPFALFGLSTGLWLLAKKDWQKILMFSGGVLIAITPWLVFNKFVYNDFLWDVHYQYNIVKSYEFVQDKTVLRKHLTNNLSFFSLTAFFGFFALLNKKNKYLMPASFFVVLSLFYYLFFVGAKYERYMLSYIAFIVLFGVVGFEFLAQKLGLKNKYWLLIITLLAVSGPFIGAFAKTKNNCLYSRDSSLYQALTFLENNETDMVLSNVWPWIGYYNNDKVGSLWSDNINFMVMRYRPEFVVYNSIFGNSKESKYFDYIINMELKAQFDSSCSDDVTLVFGNR
ncbi:hypothetical protein GOV04_01670 [Candidatus Woesearchaeota archaeon]|nr:hypothetical protein [Candidatus Woesearchaeota archaeon]